PTLQHEEQVLARDPLLVLPLLEVVPGLPFQTVVDVPSLLLHAELRSVVGFLVTPILTVLPGRVAAQLEGALLREAASTLEEELLSLPAALPAFSFVKGRHIGASFLLG